MLNAAAAIAAYDGLSGERLHDALTRGLRLASESIDSGAAKAKLDALVAFTNRQRQP